LGAINRRQGGTKISRLSGKWNRADLVRCFIFVLFYAVIVNFPFWAASPLLGLMRNGLFCVEYAGIGLLALFVPGIVAGGLLVVVIAADLICGVSQTFYLSPSECLRNAGSLFEFSRARFLIVMAVVVLTLLLGTAAAFLPVAKLKGSYRLIAAACLAAFAVFLVSVDSVTFVRGTGKVPNPFRLALPSDSAKISYFERLWFARLPMIRLLRNEIKSLDVSAKVFAAQEDGAFVQSASSKGIHPASLIGGDTGREMPNLVLVLLESWGIPSDTSIRGELVKPYFQSSLLAHYEVSQGTVPFYGPTIAGEARELCSSHIGFHLLDASRQELQGCLPERLLQLGYHTMVLHGMDGHMFDRSIWYNTIGFQEKWFRDGFRKQGLPDCVGAFTGTCDGAIAEWIGHRLAQPEANPDFVYWVTLNSHLPVPTPPPLQAADSCSISPILSQQSAFCSWYQLVANVHHSVAQLAMAKLARPTVFVIVGDHAPAFANPRLRGQFSSEVVPYIVLVPHPDDKSASSCATTTGCRKPKAGHTEAN
jgi:hypothetical protein